MSEETENKAIVDEALETNEVAPKKSKKTFRDFIDGTIFTRELILGQLTFIMFLMFLAIMYIANRYHSEKVIRRINTLQKEIKDLRSEHTSISSELMFLSKQTEVAKLLDENQLGLIEAVSPPRKITIQEE